MAFVIGYTIKDSYMRGMQTMFGYKTAKAAIRAFRKQWREKGFKGSDLDYVWYTGESWHETD